MATILLTNEEYQHIQNLREDLINRIANATPRAATHYNAIAKQCSKFIARENGKRAESQEKANDRERLAKQNETRRANNGKGQTQEPQPTPAQAGRTTNTREQKSA